MKSCTLICNIESGRGIRKKDLDKIITTLQKHEYDTNLFITKKPKDATRIVKRIKSTDLVLSIGGDGTFNEVVSGNFERNKKLLLSHIPVGTTNDIGNMWGLKSNNILSNLNDILNGEIKTIDICTINNKPFVYVAGYGKFMNVTYETPRKAKRFWGYLAYFGGGVKAFFKKDPLFELEYEINGEKGKGLYSMILVSNANRIAGFNNFYKDIKLDDNKFEVLLCSIKSKKDLIKSLTYLGTNDITKIPGLYCYKTDNFKINFTKATKKFWTVDGEKYGKEIRKYEFSFTKDIKMLIPKKNINRLFIN